MLQAIAGSLQHALIFILLHMKPYLYTENTEQSACCNQCTLETRKSHKYHSAAHRPHQYA